MGNVFPQLNDACPQIKMKHLYFKKKKRGRRIADSILARRFWLVSQPCQGSVAELSLGVEILSGNEDSQIRKVGNLSSYKEPIAWHDGWRKL